MWSMRGRRGKIIQYNFIHLGPKVKLLVNRDRDHPTLVKEIEIKIEPNRERG